MTNIAIRSSPSVFFIPAYFISCTSPFDIFGALSFMVCLRILRNNDILIRRYTGTSMKLYLSKCAAENEMEEPSKIHEAIVSSVALGPGSDLQQYFLSYTVL